MAVPKVIATVRSNGPIGDVEANPVTNRIYFTYPEPEVGEVGLLDARTNRIVKRIKVGRLPFDLAVNPRINRIYVSNFRDSSVSVISGCSNRVIKTVKVGFRPGMTAVNVRTGFIYVSSANGTVSVIDGRTNRVRTTINIGGRPHAIVINEKTNRIYVTNLAKDTVSVIDGSNQAVIATVKVGRNPVILPALNAITNRLYVANNLSRFLSVIDTRANRLLRNVPLGRLQSEVVANPLTNRIYVSSAQISRAGRLFILNGNTNKVIRTMTLPASSSTFINPITNHLFISDFDKNRMSAYDGTTLNRLVTFPGVAGNVALNPLTNRLYVGGGNAITVIQDAR